MTLFFFGGAAAAAALGVALTAGAPATAPPQQSAAAAPAARWVVDWALNQCSLVRESGGARKAGIALQLVPGTQTVDLAVVDQGWTSPPVQPGETVSIRLDSGEPVTARARRITGKGRFGLVAEAIDRGFIDRYARASSISISGKGRQLAAMPIPAAARAVEALSACEKDALQAWGIDPAALQALRRPARMKTPFERLVFDGDYPEEALDRREQGTSVVRLTIEPDGTPARCAVVSSSGSRTLDLQTCAVYVRRAKFEPALGADGAPVRSMVVTRLTWRYEGL